MKTGYLIVITAILLPLLSPHSTQAANLVGDADNSGALEMADAALVQLHLYGLVGPGQLSPLALADGDADLDLADLMLGAQATVGTVVVLGPGSLLSVTHASDPTLADGAPDYPVIFDIASNLPIATKVDGVEISIAMAPGESILSGASTTVSSGQATAAFTPINAAAPDDVYDIDAQIVVRDSADGATVDTATDAMSITVTPPACGDGVVNGTEFCDVAIHDCCDAGCSSPLPFGSVCRPDFGECDPEETCDGIAATCPADVWVPDGTLCTDDGMFCSGIEECQFGACVSPGDPCSYACPCDELFDSCCGDPFCIDTIGWLHDPANLGPGDDACFEFLSGPAINCSVNGFGVPCSYMGSGITCIESSYLTSYLSNSADCSTFTNASQRLGTIEISCLDWPSTGPTPAGFAMLTSDGIGGVGDGNNEGTVDVCAIDRWSGADHPHLTGVQIDQASLGAVTGSIAGGAGCTTFSGVEPGPITVTCASDGYKTITFDKANARTFVCPMEERAPTYERNRPVEWILEGDFDLSSFDAVYPGNIERHGACDDQLAPNPLRAGLAVLSPYRSGFADLTLDSLLGSSVVKSLAVCDTNNDGLAPGLFLDTSLPGNLILPDVMIAPFRTRFSDLRTRKADTTVMQTIGLGISPESVNIDDLLAGAEWELFSLDLLMLGQEITAFDTASFCGAGGGACDINILAANGLSFDVGHMSGYGHGFGPANAWDYRRYDWSSQEINILYDIDQGGVAYGSDEWGVYDGPNQVTEQGDNDPIRYGDNAFFGCPGGAGTNCYSDSGAGREYQGFLARETYWSAAAPDACQSGGNDCQRKATQRDGLNLYGLFVDAGLLQDHLLTLSLNSGDRVECPGGNGAGNSCTGFGALGGPLPSTAATYVNDRYPGAVTAYRGATMSTWYKLEPRGSFQIQIHSDADFGFAGCTSALGPRSGSCLQVPSSTGEMIGLPYGVQDGVSPYDMGASADVDQCKATNCGLAPGGCDACPADGGDVRNLGVQWRRFNWNANTPMGLSGNFNRSPILGRHELSVDSGGDCMDATGAPIAGLDCSDDSWTVITAGPGFSGGADMIFTLPDIGAMPGVADWRFIEPGSAGAPGDLGAGFHQLDASTCTGGDCPGQANGGIYTPMGWTLFGVGNQSLNSCTTINAYHFTEVGAGGGNVGGIYEAQSFANNTMNAIWNDN